MLECASLMEIFESKNQALPYLKAKIRYQD